MTPDWPYDPGKLGPQERWLVWCPRLCSLRLSLVSQLSYIPTGTKWTSSTTFDLEYKWLSFSLFLSAQVLQPRTCFKIKSHCWQENLCPHVGFRIPCMPQKWPCTGAFVYYKYKGSFIIYWARPLGKMGGARKFSTRFRGGEKNFDAFWEIPREICFLKVLKCPERCKKVIKKFWIFLEGGGRKFFFFEFFGILRENKGTRIKSFD